jgi:DNA-binding GntR family transcriptional regulator
VRPEDKLRAAIVCGRFLQPNERLVEAQPTRSLGVGRSAVRTALARLEHETSGCSGSPGTARFPD